MKIVVLIDHSKFRIPIKNDAETPVTTTWLIEEVTKRYAKAAGIPPGAVAIAGMKGKNGKLSANDVISEVCQDGEEVRVKLAASFYAEKRESKHRPLPEDPVELEKILGKKLKDLATAQAKGDADAIATTQRKIDVLNRKLRDVRLKAAPASAPGPASPGSTSSTGSSRASYSKQGDTPAARASLTTMLSESPVRVNIIMPEGRTKRMMFLGNTTIAEAAEMVAEAAAVSGSASNLHGERAEAVPVALALQSGDLDALPGDATIAGCGIKDGGTMYARSLVESTASATAPEGFLSSLKGRLVRSGIARTLSSEELPSPGGASLTRERSSGGLSAHSSGRGADNGTDTSSGSVAPRTFEAVVQIPSLKVAPVASLRTNQIVADAVEQLCSDMDLSPRGLRLYMPNGEEPLPMTAKLAEYASASPEFVLQATNAEASASRHELIHTNSLGAVLRRQKSHQDGMDAGSSDAGTKGRSDRSLSQSGGRSLNHSGNRTAGDTASRTEDTGASAALSSASSSSSIAALGDVESDRGMLNVSSGKPRMSASLSSRIFKIMDDLETTQAEQESVLLRGTSEGATDDDASSLGASASGASLDASSTTSVGGAGPSPSESASASAVSSKRQTLRRFSGRRLSLTSTDVESLNSSTGNLSRNPSGSIVSHARERAASTDVHAAGRSDADAFAVGKHVASNSDRARSGSTGGRGPVGAQSPVEGSLGDAVADGDADRLYRALGKQIDLCERLGKGGSCTEVFRASSRGLSFAVKIFDTTYISKAEVESINREIELMQRFRHRNIVEYLFHFVPDAAPREIWLCMEYFATPTLYDVIVKKRFASQRLDSHEIADFAVQIASGLRYLHSALDAPVIHRDLKSENIFHSADARTGTVVLKIGDFGESVMGTKAYFGWRRKVLKGANVGTAEFRAPELHREKAEGASPYSAKADIWSFGMVLFEMLTLDIPYRVENLSRFDIPKHIRRGIRPAMPPVEVAGKRALIVEVFKQCTELDAAQRPNARDVLNQLKRVREEVLKQG